MIFFLIHKDLIGFVKRVRYEDRIGYDFDHKMVTLQLGGMSFKPIEKVYNSTLEHFLAEKLGTFEIYDTLNNHSVPINQDLSRQLGAAGHLMQEYCEVEGKMYENP